jgi:hypothetical protein
MRRVLFLLAVASALTIGLFSSQASAQAVCGKRIDLLTQFARQFEEVPNGIGITDQGALLELLVSPMGTWTMIVTVPGGSACVVATGQNWETLPAVQSKPGV